MLKERLERRPKKETLARAARIDERIRFNVLPEVEGKDRNRYKWRFLQFCENNLHRDAVESFKNLFRPPYSTVSLFDKVFATLSKVFDAKDSTFMFEFGSDSAKEDWARYQAEVFGKPSEFQLKAFEKMKSNIHSMVVVDMDREEANPEPYYLFLSPEQVIDYEEIDGVIQWAVWREDDTHLVVVDDVSYQVWRTEERRDELADAEPEVYNAHDLTYCPASWFWQEEVNGMKAHPILNYLADADWYLFYKTAEKYTETYAAWPVLWAYDGDCDYEVDGQHCEGGYLYDVHGPVMASGNPKGCPKCSNRKIGAGSVVKVSQPDSQEGIPDMRDPIGFIKTPVEALKYVDEKVEKIETAIYEGVTGYGGDPSKTQAMNVEQILASVDSRRTALMKLKKNFETIHQWVVETVCKLRYGSGFSYAYVNYGQHFYFFEPEQIMEMYKESKEAGLDDVILDQLRDEYNDAKYRNSPNQAHRVKILENLDPFRHRSRDEVIAMPVNEDDKLLKLNFSSLIKRFERENDSVVVFGSALEFDAKIRAIRDVLLRYVNELKQTSNV